MIKYRLRCDKDHAFDGWFRGSASYDAQAEAGLLACPECGSTAIGKAPMAPAVASSRDQAVQTRPADGREIQAMPESMALRHHLRELRRAIEANCEYVGERFAEEARRIHNGEIDPHGIYGETTPDDARALREEGIEFASLPWMPKDDA